MNVATKPAYLRGRGGGGKGGGGAIAGIKESPNTLRSRSVARVIDVIGEGEIVGLLSGAQSILYDETRLQNKDGSYNFDGVSFAQRFGLPDQDYIPGYEQIEAEVPVGVRVLQATPVVRTISDADMTSARVTVRVPSLVSTNAETGELLPTSLNFKIEVEPDGEAYQPVAAAYTWLPFTGTVTPDNTIGIELTIGGTTSGPRVETIQITAYYRAVGATDWLVMANEVFTVTKYQERSDEGGMIEQEEYSRTMSVSGLAENDYEVRIEGTATNGLIAARALQRGTMTISGKTTSPYETSYYFPLPGTGPWNIKVTRLDADSDSVSLSNDLYFSSYTEILDVKLQYPDTAYIAMAVDAQNFGGRVPTRSYEIKGLKIQVPDNYWPEDPQITNLLKHSDNLTEVDAGEWSISQATINRTTDAESASGYRNTVTSSHVSNDPVITQAIALDPGTSEVTASVFVKAGTMPGNLRVALDDGAGNGFYVDYNMTADTLGTAATIGTGAAAVRAELLALTDGVRVSVTGTLATGATEMRLQVTALGSNNTGLTFELNGAVVAVASYARAFIATDDNTALGGQWGENRHYEGVWGGNFHTLWSDNPAWVMYDLLTHDRYGLGEVIAAEQVDKWTLYEIAVYCDELVDDGFGGTEPRFTFNGCINTREEAYRVIQAVSSSFRGMTYWGAGVVSATQDSPTDFVKIVGPANVEGGLFNYQGTGLKSKFSVVHVSWIDPADNYKPAIEVVEDPDSIEEFGYRITDVVAFGCQSKGQAARFGRWIIDTNKNEDELVTYVAGFDHSDVRPGHVVAICDPWHAGVRHAGRTVSATTTSLTIDEPIEIEVGETYSVTMTMADDSLVERDLTNSPGTGVSVLTWSSALSEVPVANSMWAITASNVEPRRFRVLGVVEKARNKFEVTGAFHDVTKYARVEEEIDLSPLDYSAIPRGALLPPSGLSHEEYLYTAGPSAKSAISLSWEKSADPRIISYDTEYKRPGQAEYQKHRSVQDLSTDILDTNDGSYSFRVRGVDGIGGKSAWAYYEDVAISGLSAVPEDVTNFRIVVSGGTATLYWDAVTDLDRSHYRVKYSPSTSGVTWGAAVDLIPVIDGTSVQVNAVTGTFLIKAYDSTGHESANATLVISNVDQLDGFNATLSLTEDPTFSATKTNMEVDTGTLILTDLEDVTNLSVLDDVPGSFVDPDDVVGIGYYTFGGVSTDLTGVYTSRITMTIAAAGSDIDNVMASWTTLSSIASLSGADPALWALVVLERHTNDDPSGTPTWTDWKPFVVGDYTARAFEFRVVVVTFAANISPVISALAATIDMPDRVSGAEDVAAGTGGVTVAYDPPFKAAPAVGIIAQDMATGDYYVVSNKDREGFDIIFRNAAGSGVARTFDWVAKGYGYERP